MFTPGTLVNVPHFRGKPLLVVTTEGQNTRCLWTSENGEMGEVLIPTALLQELQAPVNVAAALKSDETLPADWIRKAPTGLSK
jgi:hypothetical protein